MKFRLIVLLGLASSFVVADEIFVTEGLGTRTPTGRRSVVHIDPVEAAIVQGTWQKPVEGQGGWTKVSANNEKVFQGGPTGGGYIYCSVKSDAEKTMLLEASGHTMVYVNGAPRAGDPYSYGYVSLPITLHKGTNDLLFLCGRGRLQVKLVDPPKPVSLDLRDLTTPDILKGEKQALLGAVVIRNATNDRQTKLRLEVGGESIAVPAIPEMTCRKVAFRFRPTEDGKLKLRLTGAGGSLDTADLTVRIREAGQPYKRTFVSDIDGSVQYYAVNPSTKKGAGQALFLSLHGASVEAIGQAEAYSPKNWGYLVAATNRRPYGFDWEEVGRLDALEVLAHAKKEFKTDPSKTYLTGHSMGGHGTWQMGAHFPNLFAAIAPSAGWISFTTYAGGVTYTNPTPVEKMLLRAGTPSDTLGLKYNYSSEGIFILHGDADDNVPVDQARTMRKELETFHHDFNWHEEKGANHWWDASPEAGADAVDFAQIFQTFAHHRLPEDAEVRFVDFSTASPGISSRLHWATIEQQDHAYEVSRIQLRADPVSRQFIGTTRNVTRLALSPVALQGKGMIAVELDGQKLIQLTPEKDGQIHLVKKRDRWEPAPPAGLNEKGPHRYGGFKDIYRNRFILVYGTHGTPAENEWAKNKARYDAEQFWYRGNGSVDVVSDDAFDPKRDLGRNVIVYGNQQTNSAWMPLFGREVAVTARNNSVATGDAAILLIRPRVGSDTACVAGIGGTGIVGMRLTDRVPLFSSGAAIPDLLVFGPEMLEKGTSGIRVAGFYGMNWSIDTGDFVFAPDK